MFNQQMICESAPAQTAAIWPRVSFRGAWRAAAPLFAYKGRPANRPAEPPKAPDSPKPPSQQPAQSEPDRATPKPQIPAKKD